MGFLGRFIHTAKDLYRYRKLDIKETHLLEACDPPEYHIKFA
jgi:hypothetical protein